ncbi:MAG: hypothetical protein HY868_22500 [Chloroflexi bacterium]|nr:hypothetical protein [Chloroflexota bacterium]
MTFQEAERTYKDLKVQHAAGKLSDADFEAQVGKLKMQDPQGRWWQIGVQTGEWYMHDGQKWNKAKPPAETAPIPPPPPPAEAAPLPLETASAGMNSPANGEKKPGRASVAPTRLFSSKPAGREGGLPMPVLIGIIAGVAVVVILLAVGVLWATGAFNPAAQGARTPTRVAVTSPTALVVVPTVRPTDAPTLLPSPTIIAAPTITPTLAATATATRRPAGTPATKVTAVPTKAGVAASPTPAVAPGVYITKLETNPAKISIGGTDKIQVGFKATFFNNTGGTQAFKKWFVRIFQCPEQCTGDRAYRNSYGESLKQDTNVAAGASVEITTPPHANFGPGRCEYTAVPYYTGDNEIAVPFMTVKGAPLYYNFSVCN